MHILQLLPELNEGGVERGVVEMNRELVRRGVASTVVSRDGRLVPAIKAAGGRHVVLDVCSKNLLTFPARARQLRQVLAEVRPDIVHVRSRLPAWLLRAANRTLRLPVVSTVHGFNSVSAYSRIMTRADRVICVSQVIRDYVRLHYRTPDARLRVIHRGVDPAEFDPAHLSRVFVEQFAQDCGLAGRFVVTSVGRVTPLKNYETFIRAVALARRERPEILGVIVGGMRSDRQRYGARLHALVEELRAGDAIRFAGSHSHMAEIYHLSDVVVSCSAKPESFGRSLVEALAMETPVIATRHGGAMEIVREGVDGWLFAPGDAEALAQRLVEADGRTFAGLRAGALERFSLEAMVGKTLAVYREVLAERGGASGANS